MDEDSNNKDPPTKGKLLIIIDDDDDDDADDKENKDGDGTEHSDSLLTDSFPSTSTTFTSYETESDSKPTGTLHGLHSSAVESDVKDENQSRDDNQHEEYSSMAYGIDIKDKGDVNRKSENTTNDDKPYKEQNQGEHEDTKQKQMDIEQGQNMDEPPEKHVERDPALVSPTETSKSSTSTTFTSYETDSDSKPTGTLHGLHSSAVESDVKDENQSRDDNQHEEYSSMAYGIDIKDKGDVNRKSENTTNDDKPYKEQNQGPDDGQSEENTYSDPIHIIFASLQSASSEDRGIDRIIASSETQVHIGEHKDTKQKQMDIEQGQNMDEPPEKHVERDPALVSPTETSKCDQKENHQRQTDIERGQIVDELPEKHVEGDPALLPPTETSKCDQKDNTQNQTDTKQGQILDDTHIERDPASLSFKEKLKLIQSPGSSVVQSSKKRPEHVVSISNRRSTFESLTQTSEHKDTKQKQMDIEQGQNMDEPPEIHVERDQALVSPTETSKCDQKENHQRQTDIERGQIVDELPEKHVEGDPALLPPTETSKCDQNDTTQNQTDTKQGQILDDTHIERDPASLSFKEKLKLIQSPGSSVVQSSKKRPEHVVSISSRRSTFESLTQTKEELSARPKERSQPNQYNTARDDDTMDTDIVNRRNKDMPPTSRRTVERASSIRASASFFEDAISDASKVNRRNKDMPPTSRRTVDRASSIRVSTSFFEDAISDATKEPGAIRKTDSKPKPKPRPRKSASFNSIQRAETFVLKKRPTVVESHTATQADDEDKDKPQYHRYDTRVTTKSELREKDKTMVVAAIDFGTTYSGVAFAFRNNPEDIYLKTWDGEEKVPTVVLLDPDRNVYAFGHQAIHAFAEKFDKDDTYKKWFFFEHFKMKLYVKNQYLDKNIKLVDYSGKEMLANEIFGKAIGYLKVQLLELLNEKRRGVVINPTTDIHWVLTVPAIWSDLSKRFMRDAAEMAKIPSDYLSLALEPEAASLYCRRQLGVNLRGKKYIILDLGGGTADFVCHEIRQDDSIRECHMATGGDYGGNTVNDELMKCLISLYGGDVWKEFKQTREYLDFINDFETKKRSGFDMHKEFIKFKFPDTPDIIYQRKVGLPVSEALKQSSLAGKLFFDKGSLKLSKSLIADMFDFAVKQIIDTTVHIMKKVKDVSHLIMVGGFSNSQYVFEQITQWFPENGFVIKQHSPEVAVIRGAVRFGQERRAMSSRISQYTYGISRMMIFRPGDPPTSKVRVSGADWCDNRFNKHIEIGEEMYCDDEAEVQAHDYYPPAAHVRQFVLEVFASKDKDPTYTTDEGCYCVGIMPLEMDPRGDVWSKVEVKLVYKGTELELQAFDTTNMILTTKRIDFWC